MHAIPDDLEHMFDVFGKPLTCELLSADDVPKPYHALLVHGHHMTRILEQYWDQPVVLHVLHHHQNETVYERKISLSVDGHDHPVEYGAVRLHVDVCDPDVRSAILARRTPLGRILIDHGVMTNIECRCFFKMTPSREMCATFGMPDSPLYGRYAEVDFDGKPALQLLEVLPAGLDKQNLK